MPLFIKLDSPVAETLDVKVSFSVTGPNSGALQTDLNELNPLQYTMDPLQEECAIFVNFNSGDSNDNITAIVDVTSRWASLIDQSFETFIIPAEYDNIVPIFNLAEIS